MSEGARSAQVALPQATQRPSGRQITRVMVKFSFPADAGSAAIRTGKVEKVFQQLMEDLKPEAAYFHAVDGDRGGFFVVNMQESSRSQKSLSGSSLV
jgi:hypothetical protein